MNTSEIFALIQQAAEIANMAIEAGKSAKPIIDNMIALAKNGADNTVTPEQIAATRALLDQEMAKFNEELPPEETGT